MLEELKFVQGAVAKKDLLPALSHYRIENGTVRSFNGTLALCSPIAFDIDCTPKAIPFYKAIQNCSETVTLKITPAGRLNIRSGSFTAFIDCVQTETPHVLPEGELTTIDGEALLSALRALQPVIGDDASRPWSNGVLLRGQSAFATNNVVMAEYWVGSSFPIECNLPRDCIAEMLRIKEAPHAMQATENSITFHYSGKRWIRTGLLSTEWPDVSKHLDTKCNPVPINPLLFKALETIEPFADSFGRAYIYRDVVSTAMEQGEGAKFEIPGLGFEGVYQIKMLRLIGSIATNADFSLYPNPCFFYGGRVRGAFIGLRS